MRRVRRFQRRAEQRQESVAQKLVHDAAVAVEDVDQHGKGAVEPVHHFLRRARARAGGEAAEIDEHDGDAADVAVGLGALGHQALDHLRRDVLAEQIGDAVARGGRLDARLELPPQLVTDRAREHAADQDDRAARGVIEDRWAPGLPSG